ncbi:MAG: class I SAM-dependent methyltransferase, partial [Bacteroidota bacterium]
MSSDYLSANKKLWNDKTKVHVKSKFYDIPGFVAGDSSLNAIELGLLGDISGKTILHLQCHFGQDSLSLARMGAKVTGIDLSDEAIKTANDLNQQLGLDAEFICCDVLSIDQYLTEQYDIIFTSYGVTGWLPSLERWGKLIAQFLKPDGQFLIVEFHPVVWMFDEPVEKIAYSYFNVAPIIEEAEGTYTDKEAPIKNIAYYW